MKRQLVRKPLVKGLFIVGNDRGLHTRPSTEIVKCASAFRSDVKLIYKKKKSMPNPFWEF